MTWSSSRHHRLARRASAAPAAHWFLMLAYARQAAVHFRISW